MCFGVSELSDLRPYGAGEKLLLCGRKKQKKEICVKYISTRGEAPVLGFEDVLLAGLARDGGLYVPETWPTLSPETISSFSGRPFHEVAVEVISPFVGDAIPRHDLMKMAEEAYAGFQHPSVTPLVQVDRNLFILELFHGPTLAFKDVAMRLLARLMDYVLAKRNQHATIVGATSGDTGGAAIDAFRTSERAKVIVLFPDGRVSDVQRRMMTTPKEPQVQALAIKGTFDDCQALVKGMFNNHDFRDRVSLSGVNSINWARIVAQVTYYFVAAVALGAPHRKVRFSVPTGNFGDIFAGHVARKMGLPIEGLVIASNENDILPRTLTTGVYEKRAVAATTSPSMDIQVSSNFERYLFEANGRNADEVRAQMASLAQSGNFDVGQAYDALKRDFTAGAASEDEVAKVIKSVNDSSGYLLEPHTACGVIAAKKTAKDDHVPTVVLATAHPAKFPDAMGDITWQRPALPKHLSHLLTDDEHFPVLENDQAAVEAYVEAQAQTSEKDFV